MEEAHPLYQILYVSRLAPGAAYAVVNDIAGYSRQANPRHGITGVLLFDGEHFGQLIEGSEADVTTLMTRIRADARHTDIVVLFSGVSGSARHTRVWRSGYCEPQQLDAMVRDAMQRGVVALASFMSLMLDADVE